jgi:pimeloyl-ACP methyl ester carboxylesterase
MARLGYTRWVAQGGDWGSLVTDCIGRSEPPACIAIHTNMPMVMPSKALLEQPTEFEQAALARAQRYWDWESGYSKEQSTRPQTLGYGLVDSPAAQVAWIGEKYWCWTDCKGHPDNIFTRDEMLDNIMMYWLPKAGASSARLYWESFRQLSVPQPKITIPVGVSVFPEEIFRASRRWCEERFTNLIHYNALEHGGHFAAFEQPKLFVNEVRNCFRNVRG